MPTTMRKNPLTVLGAFAVAVIAGLWIAAGAVAWSGPADAEPGRGTVAEDSAAGDPFTAEPAPAERPADPRFESCEEANDAGYGYYFMGEDPEYYWYDDADGNGVSCEE